jgi:hypothetical protein
VSEQDVWDAIAALLKATPLGQDVYDTDMVPGSTTGIPGTLPETFVVLAVTRRFVPPSRSGDVTTYGYRVAVNQVARNKASARIVGEWVRLAFEGALYSGVLITVGGVELGPIALELSEDPAKDSDDRWSGSSVWTL